MADADIRSLSATPSATWRALVRALALPVLLAIAVWLPIHAVTALDGDHHALVWIDGPPDVLAQAAEHAASDRHFSGGPATHGADTLPAGCTDTAIALHFEARRDDLSQATLRALEELAVASGAQVCASQRFVLNVPARPQHETERWLFGELWQVLVLLVLPAGLVVLAYAAPFGAPALARLRAEMPSPWLQPLWLAGAGAVLVATLAAWASSGLIPVLERPAVSGLSPAFALAELALLPLLQQLVFRTWLFAQLRPHLSPAAVAAIAIAAQLLAAQPFDLESALFATGLTLACTGLYLRSREWLPPVLLHALAVALLDARLIAG
ncbi:CPBP family glutamic-type intramembrane protease [Arenimonas composti]|uniref:CAAX prenyl protease 2/Lysostaphin resistance protein A-like domain-containing protein n=1 Tax=Arenimonas composti TR7-09 = DSM 18010 TaxID=1121013 RepID=A0A091AYA2_9GAMM|nr:CPBP family glutamic-type intramembrane protease [Arenimonas composti]KFN45298.1 hypothetical protein P873_02425 [Arenimonas composti TR7-09 = DSM 18010]